MFAFFALSTVLVFVLIQCVVSRGRSVPAPRPAAASNPSTVAGFEMRDDVRFHPGHTWARDVAPGVVDVGVDDFAARLLGGAGRVDLPSIGSRLAQGARAFTVRAGPGRTADLVSPVGGEVVAVNPRLAGDPALATRAPYDAGWLCRVRCDDVARDAKHLVDGPLAARWTESAADELDFEIDSLLQWGCRDGGQLVADYGSRLDRASWRRLVSRFLLT